MQQSLPSSLQEQPSTEPLPPRASGLIVEVTSCEASIPACPPLASAGEREWRENESAPGECLARAQDLASTTRMDADVQLSRVNRARIAYSLTGSGFPLLLHGFPRPHRVWSAVTPALSTRFTVLAPDRRGYGDSGRTPDAKDHINAAMTGDALELTRQLGWERFLVTGHDKGLAVARRLAADYPECVVGAMVMDGAPEGADSGPRRDPNGRSWYLDFFRQRGVAEAVIGANPRPFFSLFLDRNPHLGAEEHEYYVQMFCRRGSVDAILADYRVGAEIDRPLLGARARAGAQDQRAHLRDLGRAGTDGQCPGPQGMANRRRPRRRRSDHRFCPLRAGGTARAGDRAHHALR